ncbi:hypothetical protein VBG40_13640 [Vagococcus fluvialis]|uniref:hypothetical protein n=1 Tax=Vagococcus fluvialis TaxID=2738 RepID=UPI003789FBB4
MKKKIMVLVLTLIITLSAVAPATTVNAQTGGGVDVCTYYNANGFKTKKSCDSWLANKEKLNQPAWQKKISKCMVKSGITGLAAFSKELRKSPKGIAITYGLSVISCIF